MCIYMYVCINTLIFSEEKIHIYIINSNITMILHRNLFGYTMGF